MTDEQFAAAMKGAIAGNAAFGIATALAITLQKQGLIEPHFAQHIDGIIEDAANSILGDEQPSIRKTLEMYRSAGNPNSAAPQSP